MNNDWARFVAMMEADPIWRKWTVNGVVEAFVLAEGHVVPSVWYYPESGVMRWGERESNVGPWRVWLEAGTSPPPF